METISVDSKRNGNCNEAAENHHKQDTKLEGEQIGTLYVCYLYGYLLLWYSGHRMGDLLTLPPRQHHLQQQCENGGNKQMV